MIKLIRALLLVLMSASSFVIWLPLNRGWMDGEVYSWSLPLLGTTMEGSGTEGDYWILSVLVLIAALAFWTLWRSSRRFAGLCSGLWFGIWTISIVLLRIQEGPILFRGDTLDSSFDATIAATLIGAAGVAAALMLLFVAPDPGGRARWTRTNTLFAALIPASYVVVYFLLSDTGGMTGITDQVGVLLLLSHMVLIHPALAVWSRD
jgi:hypothetical protein